MALQALKLQPMMVCRYIDNKDSGLRKFSMLFIGVTISLFGDPVNINEGENRTISLYLSMPTEREVPVMVRIMLRSAFSSMCIYSLSLAVYEILIVYNIR